VKITIEMVNGG